MLRATFKSLLARKLRLVLSALSIVLGVAFVSGAFVLTDSLGAAFDKLFTTVSGNVAVDVRGAKTTGTTPDGSDARKPVPASVLEAVRGIDGVSAAEGSVIGYAQLVDSKGKAVGTGGAPTYGFNWTGDTALDVGHVSKGSAPSGPHEIALNRSLAEKAGYTVGDTATVLTDGPAAKYRIVGIVEFPDGAGSLGGSTNVIFDTPTAQQVLQREGTFDEIQVAAKGGVSEQELRDRVARVLPQGTEAVTGTQYRDEQTSSIKDSLKFFNVFLLVFAAIALFVGAFIIINTFSMLVAQRTRELALLRALGASRGQVNRSVLLEAVVVGAVASVVGLVGGIGVGKGLPELFKLFGAEFPSGPTIIETRTVIAAFAVGVGVTALAAIVPSRRASRIAPIAALRDSATPDRSLVRQTIGGLVLTVGGAGLMTIGLTGGGLSWLGAGTFLAFVGIALLSPLISRPVTGALGALFVRTLPGRLGRQNSLRNPRRTASTAAALMVGLALISAVSVLGASLKESTTKIINNAVGASFILNAQGQGGFPDAVLDGAKSIAGVESVTGVKVSEAKIGGKSEFLTAVDPASLYGSVKLDKTSGSLRIGGNSLLMSSKKADAAHLRVGDTVTAQLAGGVHTFTLAGTYEENQLVGDYLVGSDVAKDFTSQTNVAALVQDKPEASATSVRAALTNLTASYPTVEVLDRSEFADETAGQVDQIVTFISILLLFSVVIAVLGVINTLALSVIERTREIGLLRAIGMSRWQVRGMIGVESVVIATFGGILGLAVGAVFGVALQQALKGQGVTELGFPVGRLVLYLILAGVAGVIAAALPARRAARLNVLEAVATE